MDVKKFSLASRGQINTTHLYALPPGVWNWNCSQLECSQLPTIQKESCKVPRPRLSGKCKHPPPLQLEMLHSWWLWKICYCHSLVCARWGKHTTRPISCLQRRRDRNKDMIACKINFS